MPHHAIPLATPLLDLPSAFDVSPISTPSDNPSNQLARRTHSLWEDHPSFVAALRLNRLFSPPMMPPSKLRPLLPAHPAAKNTMLSGRPAYVKSATSGATGHFECTGLLLPPTLKGLPVHCRTHNNAQLPHATKMQMADYLRKYERLFMVTPQRLRMVVEAFIDALEAGLVEEGQCVPMIPTFVFGLPTGKEIGPYLAVDLGGTNLRVWRVELQGDGKFEVIQAKYKLTEKQKQQEGGELFDFCAECLSKFLNDQYADDDGNLLLDADIPLGFTFSYPCRQKRIDHGELIRWTKGFGNPNVEGHDIGEMLSKSLKKFVRSRTS